MTVSCRRSASTDTGAGWETDVGTAPFCTPQDPQNRFLGGLLLPQAWQDQGNGSPQSPQNFWLLATRVWQRGQFMQFPSGSKNGVPIWISIIRSQ
jgi:hypothetical protein